MSRARRDRGRERPHGPRAARGAGGRRDSTLAAAFDIGGECAAVRRRPIVLIDFTRPKARSRIARCLRCAGAAS
jgi:hypothetical protein